MFRADHHVPLCHVAPSVRIRPRLGTALLEVLIALGILGVALISVMSFASTATHSLQANHRAEADIRQASSLLEAVALWPREDLDRHLGFRRQGPWQLRVERVAPTLYVVTLSDSSSSRELLSTSLFRPDSTPIER